MTRWVNRTHILRLGAVLTVGLVMTALVRLSAADESAARLWVVDTRPAPASHPADEVVPQFSFRVQDDDGGWRTADWDAFAASDNQALPTTFYVHGNLTSDNAHEASTPWDHDGVLRNDWPWEEAVDRLDHFPVPGRSKKPRPLLLDAEGTELALEEGVVIATFETTSPKAQAIVKWQGKPVLVLWRDPAYNPNLTLDRQDFSIAWPPRTLPTTQDLRRGGRGPIDPGPSSRGLTASLAAPPVAQRGP